MPIGLRVGVALAVTRDLSDLPLFLIEDPENLDPWNWIVVEWDAIGDEARVEG